MKDNVLICQCSERNMLSSYDIEDVVDKFKDAGIPVMLVPDLCSLTLSKNKFINQIVDNPSNSVIFACHKRAVDGLLKRQNGDDKDLSNLNVINMKSEWRNDFDQLILQYEEKSKEVQTAWYPVIDYERCNHCGECLEFCLFDVFENDPNNGKVVVSSPLTCKDKCPACARVCQSKALIFAKHESSEIAGEVINTEDSKKSKIRVDIAELIGESSLSDEQRTKFNSQAEKLGFEVVRDK